MPPIASIWTLFGLDGDPYFQDPLSPDVITTSPRSTNRFVGRKRELQLVGGHVVGTDPEGSSRSVIEGAPGVGKTSFVNRVKAVLVASKSPVVLSHAQPIRVRDDATPRSFAADVLRTLLLIHEESSVSAESAQAERFWRRIRRIVHGEDTTAGGISVAGVGGSFAQGRIAAEDRDGALYDEVANAFKLLAGSRHRRIVLHINNLENLTLEAMSRAARLMQNLRDHFLLAHSHWIFVGATGIDAAVFRAAPQVSGIMPPSLVLEPLSADDVAEILWRRYRALQRGRKLIPPVAPDAVSQLYGRYQGDLRNFLRILSNGVRTAAVAPATPLGVADIIRGVAPDYRRALLDKIGETDLARLEAAVRRNPTSPAIRASDLVDAAQIGIDVATRTLASLEERGVIMRSHTEGRSVYFKLTGNTWAALGI